MSRGVTEQEREEQERQVRLQAALSERAGIFSKIGVVDLGVSGSFCPSSYRRTGPNSGQHTPREFVDPGKQSLLPPVLLSASKTKARVGASHLLRSASRMPSKNVEMKALNQLAGYSQNQKGWFGLEVLAQSAGAGVGTNMLVTALGIAALGGSTMGWGLVAGVVILLVSAYFGCSPSTIFSHVTSYPRQRNHRLYADQGIDDQIKCLVRLSQDYYTSTQHTVKKLVESVCSRYTLMKGVSSSMSLFKSDASSILLRKLKAFKALDEFTSSHQDDLLAAILDYLKDRKNQGKALFTAIVLAAKELQASPSPQSAASPAF